jgi:hypothetical protein
MSRRAASPRAGKHGKLVSLRRSARGMRQIFNQGFSEEVTQGIELLMFLREAAYRREPSPRRKSAPPSLEELWDAALAEFLAQYDKEPATSFPTAGAGRERRPFWVDVELGQRCRKIAEERGVKTARVVDAAISGYVLRRVGPRMNDAMAQIGAQASAILAAAERQARQLGAEKTSRSPREKRARRR